MSDKEKNIDIETVNNYTSYDQTLDDAFKPNEWRHMLVRTLLPGMIQMDLQLRNKFYKALYKARPEIIHHPTPKRDEIVFYDDNNKIIAKSEYQILGTFNKKEKFWQWAWAVSSEQLAIDDIKHLYLAKLIYEKVSQYLIPYMRFFFLTSMFYCKEKIQFDTFISLCRGFTNNPYIIMYSPYKIYKQRPENEDFCIALTDKDSMNQYWETFSNDYVDKHKYEFI